MKTIEPVKQGDQANSAKKMNEIIEALNTLMSIGIGPGLAGRQTHTGLHISAMTQKSKGFIQSFDGGTLSDMDSVQGTRDTDTWDRNDDDCPVAVDIITDIQYSNVTHKIQFRTRTLTFDRGGNLKEISAESDLVDITTAIACTAQL